MPLSVTNFDTLKNVSIVVTPKKDLSGRPFLHAELKARENTTILTISPVQAEFLIDKLNDCLDIMDEAKEAK